MRAALEKLQDPVKLFRIPGGIVVHFYGSRFIYLAPGRWVGGVDGFGHDDAHSRNRRAELMIIMKPVISHSFEVTAWRGHRLESLNS